MPESSIYTLWKKLLFRNPRLADNVRDTLIEADLTQEERELVEKEWLNSSVSAGKYRKDLYGSDVETMGDAYDKEEQRGLARQQDNIQAYKKDVEGSYQQAKQKAQDNGFFTTSDDPRDEFINRARAIALQEFEKQRREETQALVSRYNIPKSKIDSGIISVLDTPVSVVRGIGRDMGEFAGHVQNEYAAAASGVFGEDSSLSKGLDRTSRIAGALTDEISNIVTASPWISKGIRKAREAGEEIKDIKQVSGFFDGLHNVYSSWLRNLVFEFADVLDEWYHDPRTLCCFIKNIAALGHSVAQNEKFMDLQKRYLAGEESWTDLTGTRKFFDKIIAVLRIIKQFLGQDISFSFMLSLDLGLSLSKASLGAIVAFLAALQQMLEDTIYAELLKLVENSLREEWRQCFPFERLLKILADFLTGPDGLLKYIEQYVDSFLAGFMTDTHFGFNTVKKQQMIDLTAIDRLIAIIEAIRDALMNLELCIEADFRETSEITDDASATEDKVGIGNRNYSDLINRIKDPQAGQGSGLGKVIFPTDTEVKALIMNRLGETESFADQVIATANKTSQIAGRAAGSVDDSGADSGKMTMEQVQKAIGDCSRTLDQDKIRQLAKLMSDWDLTI